MKQLFALLFFMFSMAAMAEVSGVVRNAATGQPQAGVTITVTRVSEAGMQPVGSTKSGADGSFMLPDSPQLPALLQASFGGVNYNRMMPPGQMTTALEVNVYPAAKAVPGAGVSQHMVLYEPSADGVSASERYVVSNPSQQAWSNPGAGTVRFWLPAGLPEGLMASVKAPDGMPVRRPLQKKSANEYTLDFAIKPGDTEIDLEWSAPGRKVSGRRLYASAMTKLVVPAGVSLTGSGLREVGVEPRTQAHIYDLSAANWDLNIEGTATPRAPETPPAEEEQQQIVQMQPLLQQKLPIFLGIFGGMLVLSFVYLLRRSE
jgi:hypothetical protein